MIKKLIDKTTTIQRKLKSSGFYHIIISSTLVKIASFISAIVLPRIIVDKGEYGLLSYVDNIRSYILMINGLGITYAIIRYCAKEKDNSKRWGYYVFILKFGIIVDFIIVITTIILSLSVPEKFEGQSKLVIIAACMPIVFIIFDSMQLYLRACFKNKEYSYLSFMYALLMLLFQVVAGIISGITGVVIIRYFAIMLAIIYGYYLIKKTKIFSNSIIKPDKAEKKEMVIFGIVMLLSNASSTIMSLNEVQILAFETHNTSVLAEYKVATYIFLIAIFISQSITIYIFPYFSKNMGNPKWIWTNYKTIMCYNAGLMIILHIGLWFILKPFTIIVFGEQYITAIPFMKLLLIASFGQTVFRNITGNVLAATGGEKFNLLVNIVSIFVHFTVSLVSIKTIGAYGIVIGPIVIYYLSSIPMIIYLYKKTNNKLYKNNMDKSKH